MLNRPRIEYNKKTPNAVQVYDHPKQEGLVVLRVGAQRCLTIDTISARQVGKRLEDYFSVIDARATARQELKRAHGLLSNLIDRFVEAQALKRKGRNCGPVFDELQKALESAEEWVEDRDYSGED